MAARDIYVDNVLRERWDDTARAFTAWNASGAQTSTRPYTAAENAAADAQAAQATRDGNTSGIRTKLQTAIDANATYLAVTAPTNAQVVAQVARLTREATGLMRLELNATDTTDGT